MHGDGVASASTPRHAHPGPAGRTASHTGPTSASLKWPSPPSRTAPAAFAAATFWCTVLRSTRASRAIARNPSPASDSRNTSTDLEHGHLPERHPATSRSTDRVAGYHARQARPRPSGVVP